jgi:hypothetical protein
MVLLHRPENAGESAVDQYVEKMRWPCDIGKRRKYVSYNGKPAVFELRAGSAAGVRSPARGGGRPSAGPMRITKIDVVKFRQDLRIQGITPNWIWVRLHTNTGIMGVGESYPGTDAHVGALKELARLVIGKDPTNIERLWQMFSSGFTSRGRGFRMLTAINIAQWDILGKAAACPSTSYSAGRPRTNCWSTTP